MKKSLLLLVLSFITGLAFSAKITIINSSFEFSPDDISIDFGDTVVFQLASIHNAVEVSEATWNANGNAPLPGFSVGFGGGTVTGLSVGVHFYVCTPHASGGMKGKITVNSSSGIYPNLNIENAFKIYPNPTSGMLVLENTGTVDGGFDNFSRLEIFNILGEMVYSLNNIDLKNDRTVDVSGLPSGNYIIRIKDDENTYTSRVVKND